MNLNIARGRHADIAILVSLIALMALTRVNHFAAVPDASWAVFFAGGLYLRRWTAWAFPLLMAAAIFIDYVVITAQGQNFWQHYCVSPGYWMLVPAYFSLWAGGMWLSKQTGKPAAVLAKAAAAVAVSVAACQLFSQGGFYWMTDVVASKSIAGWAKTYNDWLWPYMGTTFVYVAIGAALHAAVTQIAAGLPRRVGA